MQKNLSTICLLLIITSLFSQKVKAEIKNIRIAHFIADDISTIPDDFLQYAQSCGYNYLLAHGNNIGLSSGKSDWRNPTTMDIDGTYDIKWAKSNISLYNKLKDLFNRADMYGLRVIPCFNMSSRWAGHWTTTNKNIALNTGTDKTGRNWRVPVFIADPNGIDKSFQSYLSVVSSAFRDANTRYSQLDYIHIGHDETMGFDGKLLIGRWNNAEKTWIQKNGNNASAFCKLMAEEVIRRVNVIKATLPGTKAIIWADAWDPESNGGNSAYKGWTSGGWISVQTKDVVTRSELSILKNDLVLMPWQYTPEYATGDGYAPDISLQYFKDNGFKVIVGTSLNDFPGWPPEDSRIMNKEWVSISKDSRFKDVVIGCCCHTWSNDGMYWNSIPKPIRFQILPEFAKMAGFFPNIQPTSGPVQ